MTQLLGEMEKCLPYSTDTMNSIEIDSAYFDHEIHLYSSAKLARRWNDVRLLSLYVCEVLRSALVALWANRRSAVGELLRTRGEQALFDITEKMAMSASSGILRSVPYFLALPGSPKWKGGALILPLSSIIVSKVVSEDAKSYARGRLQYLGTTVGNDKAKDAYEMSMNAARLERW